MMTLRSLSVKRLNPETNQPFERGYRRADGRYFFQYTIKKVKRNGFFEEKWLSESALANYLNTQRKLKKIHAKNNPDKVNAKSNKRRAKKLERILPWVKGHLLKEIEAFYTMAKELERVFPWKQHVDHIVPMNGKNVSGLHLPWNLQILSEKENKKKGNKHVEENTTTPVPAGDYSQGEIYPELGPFSTPWFGQDGDDPDNHSGTVSGQDADHRAQASSGDSLGFGGEEVGAPSTP